MTFNTNNIYQDFSYVNKSVNNCLIIYSYEIKLKKKEQIFICGSYD